MSKETTRGWPTVTSTSSKLLSVARKAVNRSKTERDQAIVAVLFASAAVEGCINDIMDFSGFISDEPETRMLHDLLVEAEQQRAQIALKLQIIGAVLRRTPLKRGEQLYQDFELLFRLRNSLVHMRPDRGESDLFSHKRKSHKPSDDLISRGVIRKKDAEDATNWLDLISTYDVAQWAYDAAVRIALDIFAMISSERLKAAISAAWGEDKPISISFPRSSGVTYVAHR